MRSLHLTGMSLSLLLVACGGGGDSRPAEAPSPMTQVESFEPVRDMSVARSKVMSDPSPPAQAEPSPEFEQQYIAYSHAYSISLPRGGVDPMMTTHTQECQAAGATTCIVINSNVRSEDEAYASGNLSIRATPEWIEQFLADLEEEAEAAGGSIIQRTTSAEDLTRSIIDTTSRLEAQRTLRTRLLGLLERRDGELGELLQIERELARVTSQIESVEAQLKTLQLRVSMSRLDLSYQTEVPPFSATRENPLGEAIGDFFYNFSGAIAAVITAFAVGLPWIVLIAIFLWIWLKLIWPRLRGRKKKAGE
ncbi:MAG: DUF4349 domain-containing protein [Pseudomonadota bacterium]